MEWIEGGWSLREVLGADEEDMGLDSDDQDVTGHENVEELQDEPESVKAWDGLNLGLYRISFSLSLRVQRPLLSSDIGPNGIRQDGN